MNVITRSKQLQSVSSVDKSVLGGPGARAVYWEGFALDLRRVYWEGGGFLAGDWSGVWVWMGVACFLGEERAGLAGEEGFWEARVGLAGAGLELRGEGLVGLLGSCIGAFFLRGNYFMRDNEIF